MAIDENCVECEGTGSVDYLISVDDTRKMDCEVCNLGGSDYDEDAEYERQRDAETEAYFERVNDRD